MPKDKNENEVMDEEATVRQGADIVPPEVQAAAEEADAVTDKAFEEAAPLVTAAKDEVADLVGATNDVLKLFEGSTPVADAAVALAGEPMPDDLVRALSMITAAATDAGIDEAAYDLDEMTDGRDLLMLTGKLNMLAKSRPFKQFLKQQVPPQPLQEEEEAVLPPATDTEVAPPDEGPSDIDLFASRI